MDVSVGPGFKHSLLLLAALRFMLKTLATAMLSPVVEAELVVVVVVELVVVVVEVVVPEKLWHAAACDSPELQSNESEALVAVRRSGRTACRAPTDLKL